MSPKTVACQIKISTFRLCPSRAKATNADSYALTVRSAALVAPHSIRSIYEPSSSGNVRSLTPRPVGKGILVELELEENIRAVAVQML